VACVDDAICDTEPVPPVSGEGKLETTKEVVDPEDKIIRNI
jgi:hypothetical protein